MQIKTLLSAAALGFAVASVQADDIVVNVPLVPDAAMPGSFSAAIGITHIEAGAFTDTITFVGASEGFVSASLVTVGFVDSQVIDFTSVSINGNHFDLTSAAGVDIAVLATVPFDGQLVMTVSGIAAPNLGVGTTISASYGGTINVTPIPEPETGAMLLAGLGVLGWLRRRRMSS
jgi:hypothetical protein